MEGFVLLHLIKEPDKWACCDCPHHFLAHALLMWWTVVSTQPPLYKLESRVSAQMLRIMEDGGPMKNRKLLDSGVGGCYDCTSHYGSLKECSCNAPKPDFLFALKDFRCFIFDSISSSVCRELRYQCSPTLLPDLSLSLMLTQKISYKNCGFLVFSQTKTSLKSSVTMLTVYFSIQASHFKLPLLTGTKFTQLQFCSPNGSRLMSKDHLKATLRLFCR